MASKLQCITSRARLPAVVGAVAVVLAGCGGGGGSKQTAAAAPANATAEQLERQFVDVVKALSRSVVQIQTDSALKRDGGDRLVGRSHGLGGERRVAHYGDPDERSDQPRQLARRARRVRGRTIGIPTLAATDLELGGAQAPGIDFAIPSVAGQDTPTPDVLSSVLATLSPGQAVPSGCSTSRAHGGR